MECVHTFGFGDRIGVGRRNQEREKLAASDAPPVEDLVLLIRGFESDISVGSLSRAIMATSHPAARNIPGAHVEYAW